MDADPPAQGVKVARRNTARGDTFEMLAEDGEPAETVEVTAPSKIDARRLVRTLEVSPLEPDPL